MLKTDAAIVNAGLFNATFIKGIVTKDEFGMQVIAHSPMSGECGVTV